MMIMHDYTGTASSLLVALLSMHCQSLASSDTCMPLGNIQQYIQQYLQQQNLQQQYIQQSQ